jgi:hypothetical protein
MDVTKISHLFLTHFRELSSKNVRKDFDNFSDDGGLTLTVRAVGKALYTMQCVNSALETK